MALVYCSRWWLTCPLGLGARPDLGWGCSLAFYPLDAGLGPRVVHGARDADIRHTPLNCWLGYLLKRWPPLPTDDWIDDYILICLGGVLGLTVSSMVCFAVKSRRHHLLLPDVDPPACYTVWHYIVQYSMNFVRCLRLSMIAVRLMLTVSVALLGYSMLSDDYIESHSDYAVRDMFPTLGLVRGVLLQTLAFVPCSCVGRP